MFPFKIFQNAKVTTNVFLKGIRCPTRKLKMKKTLVRPKNRLSCHRGSGTILNITRWDLGRNKWQMNKAMGRLPKGNIISLAFN